MNIPILTDEESAEKAIAMAQAFLDTFPEEGEIELEDLGQRVMDWQHEMRIQGVKLEDFQGATELVRQFLQIDPEKWDFLLSLMVKFLIEQHIGKQNPNN